MKASFIFLISVPYFVLSPSISDPKMFPKLIFLSSVLSGLPELVKFHFTGEDLNLSFIRKRNSSLLVFSFFLLSSSSLLAVF